jgi:hypothetical protein
LSWCGLLGFVLVEGVFKFKRRTIAKGGMQPFSVVNVGDEVIDAGACIDDAGEGPRIQLFVFERLNYGDTPLYSSFFCGLLVFWGCACFV